MTVHKLFLLGITMLTCSTLLAQEQTIQGVVSDANGPLPGAIVAVKGTTYGFSTDFDGYYVLKAKAGDIILFSATGYEEQRIVVNRSATLNILLKQSEVKLKEVLPYEPQIKPYKETASMVIPFDKIEYRLAESTIALKDMNAPEKYDEPLYVLDGQLITKSEFSGLQSENIASVQILKNSENIYSPGRHNVIVITSKKLSKKELRKRKRLAKIKNS